MSTLQTNNKITVIRETDQIAQMARCFLTDVYLLKAAGPARLQNSSYVTIPSDNFSLMG